ncbi:MAG: SAM-dependent methyltransferase [bacterium]|nr:SAM-dependent methyltransferase [bacterium]
MQMALYDPDGGYFATGPLRSHSSGDFLTSPEVSPQFGATLARYVEVEHRRLGAPDGFTVVEVGAGSGSLLEPLLGELSFTPRSLAVEVSTAARESIRTRLPQVEVVCPRRLPARLHGVVIANELVDNLPMAIAVRKGKDWTERWVGHEAGELSLLEVPVRPEVAVWLDAYAGDTPEGGVVECQIEASEWLAGWIDRVVSGSILVIDYGDTAEGLRNRRTEGTLRTYRSHHLGPHPLDEPGATDLTADVNFSALLGLARDRGMECELLRQRELLDRLGLGERLQESRRRELVLARTGHWQDRLRTRSRVKEIETLFHPRGLGDFMVLSARR